MKYKVQPKNEISKAGRPPQNGEAAKGHIHMRVTMARKNAYVRAAKPRKLTEWIFEQLDKASGYEPTAGYQAMSDRYDGPTTEDAYEMGEKAAASGAPKDECPFSEGHPFRDEWLSGHENFRQ